jgi:THO complex subunit 2
MPDIAFSAESYQKAIDKVNAMEKEVASWRMSNTTEQKAERARLKARAEMLTKERDAHAAMVNGPNRRRLRLESGKWFGKCKLRNQVAYPRERLT